MTLHRTHRTGCTWILKALASAAVVFVAFPGQANSLPPDDDAGTERHTSPPYVEVSGNVVSINARHVKIDTILKRIADQSGLIVDQAGALETLVTLNLHKVPLPEALHRLLRGQDFALHFVKRQNVDGNGPAGPGKLWIFSKSGGRDSQPGTVVATGSDGSKPRDTDRYAPEPNVSDSVQHLRLTLADDDASARVDSILALAEIGTEEAKAALASALGDADPWVREEAAYAYAMDAGVNEFHMLQQVLKDNNVHVRQAVVEALAYAQADATAIGVALNDPDSAVRALAVQLLGDLGGDTALHLLEQVREDPDPEVREEATIILRDVYGNGIDESAHRLPPSAARAEEYGLALE